MSFGTWYAKRTLWPILSTDGTWYPKKTLSPYLSTNGTWYAKNKSLLQIFLLISKIFYIIDVGRRVLQAFAVL